MSAAVSTGSFQRLKRSIAVVLVLKLAALVVLRILFFSEQPITAGDVAQRLAPDPRATSTPTEARND
jgi:hypothetical protein